MGLIAPIVRAIQALAGELASLEQTVAGFADSFSTKELTFSRAVGNELDVQKLCIGATCVTEYQLKALLASANQSGGSSTPPPSSGSNASTTSHTPPVIQINGGNPAILHIGDSYADLGATITGPQADINLGIRTYLNGSMTSPQAAVQIDTTQVATDTIQYVVSDASGLTATSTRTVIVRSPDSARPTEVINPNVATTSPSAAATSTGQ